jgi:3-deoxy-D-manno-octulosonic-acid transferase
MTGFSDILYQIVLLLLRPIVRWRALRRARGIPAERERLEERFGQPPLGAPRGAVWFHAVSVGEVIAAAPIIARFGEAHPEVPILVTTMTATGAAEVSARLGSRVTHAYAPYDFRDAVERFLNALCPCLLVLVETELWPNLIRAAKARGIPVLMVNARLSARSARRYRLGGALVRNMLAGIDHVACQYPAHARRFAALGVAVDRLSVTGNVKFDAELPAGLAARATALRARYGLGSAPVWIAASTHVGEESLVLEAHRAIRARLPGTRLILVPRHATRADAVAALCMTAGVSLGRFSAPSSSDTRAEVLLVDAMGVLLEHYALAMAAFVGGSLVPAGGHNPIEPAQLGIPVAMGPHVHNFADVVDYFEEADSPIPPRRARRRALRRVASALELAQVVGDWLADPDAAGAAGAEGQQRVARARGASDRVFALLESSFARSVPVAGASDNGAPLRAPAGKSQTGA